MWACIGVSEVSFLIWCGPARRVEGVMDLPSPTVITMWYGVCICTGDSTKLDPLKVTQCHWNLNTVRSSRVVVTSCWSPHSTYRISFNCIVSEICGYIGRKTHFLCPPVFYSQPSVTERSRSRGTLFYGMSLLSLHFLFSETRLKTYDLFRRCCIQRNSEKVR